LGDTAGAERELNAFIKDFPESPLMIAAVKRVARFHDQNIPEETEKLWKVATELRAARDKESRRQAALCGPQCLAELLRRLGKTASVEELAAAMKTSEDGTSLLALRDEARRRGFVQAEGVQLTEAGLKAQKLPLIALLAPGHFVVVEKVSDKTITIWEPGAGKRNELALASWVTSDRGGIALTLDQVVKVVKS
jgi:ABC-type bacteriocin/lantibiotic exporter with double-glycine peptidase domain